MINRRSFLTGSLSALLPFGHARAEGRRRLAAIDWAAAESLLALGLPPLAVADTGYYNQRMPQRLPPETKDIGPFWEINLERLDRLRPDLVFIGAPSLFMTPRLWEIAPVEVVTEKTGEDSYQRAGAILRQCCRAAALPDSSADGILDQIEHQMDILAQSLDRTQPICVLLPDQSGSRAMVYGTNSMPDAVLKRLGLINAWQGPTNAGGFVQVGFEALMPLKDAIFVQMEIPSLAPQTDRALADSELWQRLSPVRENRIVRIGQFYPFGGCLSTLHLATALSKAVSSQQKRPMQ